MNATKHAHGRWLATLAMAPIALILLAGVAGFLWLLPGQIFAFLRNERNLELLSLGVFVGAVLATAYRK